LSDCCLTPIQQFFSYIMARTSQFSMRWWWGEHANHYATDAVGFRWYHQTLFGVFI